MIKTYLRRLLISPEFWACLLLAVLGVGLWRDWTWLRGNEEFQWLRFEVPGLESRLWVTAVILALIGMVSVWLISRRWRDARLPARLIVMAILVILGLAARIAFQYFEHPDLWVTLFYRTVSTRNLGAFYYDALQIHDLPSLLRVFPQEMANFASSSPQTHPPGNMIIFQMAAKLLESQSWLTAVIAPRFRDYICAAPESPILFFPDHALGAAAVQVAMPLWGALTVVPFFVLARRLRGTDAAVRAGVFLALTPAMVLFMGHWAHAYTLLATVALLLVYIGLQKGRLIWIYLGGLVLSIATFMSFSNIAVAALLFAYLAAYHGAAWCRGEWGSPWTQRARTIAGQILAFLAGAITVWVVYRLAFGVSFLDVYRTGMATHIEITGYRSYGLWLFANLFDFWLFMGIPFFIALIAMLVRIFSRPADTDDGLLAYAPFWAFVVVLLGLDLAGITRGEVARLWMPFVPAAWLAVLPILQRWTRSRLGIMLAVQLTQLLLLGVFIRTVGPSNYPTYVPRPVTMAVPFGMNPTDASFGGDPTIHLLGYDVTGAGSGQSLDVTLDWQADGRVPHPYTVFVHLLNADGELVAQNDSMPQDNAWPTTCWRPGEVVVDTHHLDLAEPVPAGASLAVGLYQLDLVNLGDPDANLDGRWPGGQGTVYQLPLPATD